MNNEAERTIRSVKVQQRSSGGCWCTLEGLAGFAVIQSTAAKWGLSKLDALRDLFNGLRARTMRKYGAIRVSATCG